MDEGARANRIRTWQKRSEGKRRREGKPKADDLAKPDQAQPMGSATEDASVEVLMDESTSQNQPLR